MTIDQVGSPGAGQDGPLHILLRAMDASVTSGLLGNAAWLVETTYRIADEAEVERRARTAFMEH